MLLVLGTGLRAFKLCEKLSRNEVRTHWERADDDGDDEGGGSCLPTNGKLMGAVWGQAGQLVLDVAFVPVFLLVFCSGWRTAALLRKVREAKGMKKRLATIKQLGALLVDVPHVLAGGVVLLTGWRARLLVRALRKADGAVEAREAALEQFALLVRDVPCFGLLLLLAATLYRLPGTLLKLRAATTTSVLDVAAHPPQLSDVTARASIDDKGVVRLLLRGTKPASYAPARLSLGVGGDAFWEAVATVVGGGAAAVAKSYLPLRLVPKYLSVDSLPKAGATDATLDIRLSGAAKATVEKKLGALVAEKDPTFTLQVRDASGVAASIELSASDLASALGVHGGGVESSAAAAVDASDGTRALRVGVTGDGGGAFGDGDGVACVQDVFWSVVALEALQLLLDSSSTCCTRCSGSRWSSRRGGRWGCSSRCSSRSGGGPRARRSTCTTSCATSSASRRASCSAPRRRCCCSCAAASAPTRSPRPASRGTRTPTAAAAATAGTGTTTTGAAATTCGGSRSRASTRRGGGRRRRRHWRSTRGAPTRRRA